MIRGLLACCLLLLAPPGSAEAGRGITVQLKTSERTGAPDAGSVQLYTHSYALVVGINHYHGGWPRLSKAVEDAQAVAEALRAKGFEVTLKRDLDSEKLYRAFKQFFAIKGADPDARLLLWYAGHGHTIDGEGYLVPADAPPATSPAFKVFAIPMRDFGSLVRMANARHVLSIFDSCFSGTIFQARAGAAPTAITRKTIKPVREFLTSGDAGQQVRDDGSFREYFIRAISGEERADFNNDGYVTGEELGLFMAQSIAALTNAAQTPRFGKLQDVRFNMGDYVFRLPGGAMPTDRAPDGSASPPVIGAESASIELAFWNSIKESRDPAMFTAYLKKFPNGTFAELARIKAERLATLSSPRAARLAMRKPARATRPPKIDLRELSCRACHAIKRRKVGPSFARIAQAYGSPEALAQMFRNGFRPEEIRLPAWRRKVPMMVGQFRRQIQGHEEAVAYALFSAVERGRF